MCRISEEIFNEGYAEGLEQGLEQGFEQGLEQVLFNNVRKLVANLGMSVSEAFDVLEVSEEDRERYLAMDTCDSKGLPPGVTSSDSLV